MSRDRSSDGGKVPGNTPRSSQNRPVTREDALASLRELHPDILMRLDDAGVLEFVQRHPDVLKELDNPVVLEGFIRSFDPVPGSTLSVSPWDDDWGERLAADEDAANFPPLLGERKPSGTNVPIQRDSEPLQHSSLVPVPEAPLPVREISLARCRVTDFREEGNVETFLSEERKTYPNGSKVATLTKEVSVSNTISRTVTVQWGKIKAYNAGAGVTLVGVFAIQSQVQQQLSKNYSIEMHNSITISETSTIEVPPGSTVEHIIKWKLVSLSGVAVLGENPRFSRPFDLAEVPYQLPLRLTYSEDLNDIMNDVPQTESAGGDQRRDPARRGRRLGRRGGL